MSKDVAPSHSASSLSLSVMSYKSICENLMGRMREKLDTQNPYLLPSVSRVIWYLEFCATEVSLLDTNANAKNLSTSAKHVLEAGSKRCLDNVRYMETLIGPFEDDWVIVPRDVKRRCRIICLEMFLVAVELSTIRMIAMLAAGSKSDSRKLFGVIRTNLIRRRATIAKIAKIDQKASALQKRNEEPMSQPNMPALEESSAGEPCTDITKPSESDDWSDIGSQAQTPTSLQPEELHLADHDLECCEGLTRNVSEMHAKEKARSELQKKLDESKAFQQPLYSVIDAMSPDITDEEIAVLVFHWTKLEYFNGYQRGNQQQAVLTRKVVQEQRWRQTMAAFVGPLFG